MRSVIDRMAFRIALLLFGAVELTSRIMAWLFPRGGRDVKRRILIVADGRLGDFIYDAPLYHALRKCFPHDGNHIVVATATPFSPLAEAMPYFDEVRPCDAVERHPLVWIAKGPLRWAWHRQFDILVVASWPRVAVHDWLCRLFRPSVSIAYESRLTAGSYPYSEIWQRGKGDRLWRHLVPDCTGRSKAMDFQEFIDAASSSGVKADPSHKLLLKQPAASSSSLDDAPGRPMAVLVPGANAKYRQWPLARFAELARQLKLACPGIRFVVVGNSKEAELGRALAAQFADCMTDLCGKTDLVSLAQLLSPRDGTRKTVISNETGTAHLAAALGTPTVVILGGGDFGRLFPMSYRDNVRVVSCEMKCFNCGWRCSKTDLSKQVATCVADVGVDSVFRAAMDVMADIVPLEGADSGMPKE